MSGHDAQRPPHSLRRASYNYNVSNPNGDSCELSHSFLLNPSAHHCILSAVIDMPSFERNQYTNKEGTKVNAGIIKNDPGSRYNFKLATKPKIPTVDIDFSQLAVPIVKPEAPPSASQLVERLLHPPPYAFVHGTLSIQWTIGVIGTQHFNFRVSDERHILGDTAELRLKGTTMGLPAVYLEWLCGDDESDSATEQGVCLTPRFFSDIG